MAKIGTGHFSAWFRQGMAELRAAMYPESNVAQPTQYGMVGTKTPGEVSAERADQPAHSPGVFGRQAEYHYSAQPSASSKAAEAFGRDASASQEVQAKASIEARSREGVERAARVLERE
jgi:hypothetical protein